MSTHGIRLMLSLCDSEAGFSDYLRLSPKREDFRGESELEVFDYVSHFATKFGAMPKWETVLDEGKKKGWDFHLPTSGHAPEPPEFYHDKVVERRIHYGLKMAMEATAGALNEGNPHEAFDLLMQRMQSMAMQNNRLRLTDYAQEAAGMIKASLVLMASGGNAGVHMGWPYLDGMTGGLMPGDVLSIIGRPAQGKSFAVLYSALHHWEKQGGIPLVVSMEMNTQVLMQRLASMDTKISLTHLKTGMLDKNKQLKPMMKKLVANQSKQPFYLVDGALAATPRQAKLLCQQLKPSCLWLDGAYLMQNENKRLGRWERVTENAEQVKGEIAEGLGIPVVQSYQFNRAATQKKHGPPGVEDIAYTDAIGQLSSVVLGMMQAESVETMLKRTISILKGRSGEVGQFDINWRFSHPDAMNFSQYVEPAVAELSYM